MGRVHKLVNDPDFKNKLTNYFDLIKTNLLQEYSSKVTKTKADEGKNCKASRKHMSVASKGGSSMDPNMKSTNRSRRTGS